MAMNNYNLGRWTWAWLVECETCQWYNFSHDKPWTKHAGVVHSTMLRPGHVVTEIRRIEKDD